MRLYTKVICFIIWILFWSSVFALDFFSNEPEVYTKEKDQIVWDADITDPLRQWWTNIASKTEWVINSEIKDSNQAQSSTLDFIKWIINYFLALLWFIVLVYLIYHWFLAVTAAWDDWKYKKWTHGVKIAAIWIVAIAVSWFIVSLVVEIIKKITS